MTAFTDNTSPMAAFTKPTTTTTNTKSSRSSKPMSEKTPILSSKASYSSFSSTSTDSTITMEKARNNSKSSSSSSSSSSSPSRLRRWYDKFEASRQEALREEKLGAETRRMKASGVEVTMTKDGRAVFYSLPVMSLPGRVR